MRKNRHESGSVLLEALIAILIFSAGILALVGLQAAAMKNTTQSKARIDASLVASQRIGEMWVNIPGLSTFVETDTEIAELPNGKRSTAVVGDQATVTVTWQMPGETTPNTYQTIARINTNP